ncbi:MAG TPA: hypothetical protein VNO55_20480 [Polyangia bacterium]|nr:hypothetical protein [Polyangia bacterium]
MISDPDVLFYLGPYSSGATKVSLPVLTRAGWWPSRWRTVTADWQLDASGDTSRATIGVSTVKDTRFQIVTDVNQDAAAS